MFDDIGKLKIYLNNVYLNENEGEDEYINEPIYYSNFNFKPSDEFIQKIGVHFDNTRGISYLDDIIAKLTVIQTTINNPTQIGGNTLIEKIEKFNELNDLIDGCNILVSKIDQKIDNINLKIKEAENYLKNYGRIIDFLVKYNFKITFDKKKILCFKNEVDSRLFAENKIPKKLSDFAHKISEAMDEKKKISLYKIIKESEKNEDKEKKIFYVNLARVFFIVSAVFLAAEEKIEKKQQ